MKRLIVALGFLTRLPMPRVDSDAADFAAAIRYYPVVGFVIGGVVLAGWWAGTLLDPWLGAFAALAVWVAVTGALHLDGLGDLADASGAAHRDRARLIAVLADPHIGGFGVVAIVLQLLAKLVLLHALPPAAWGAVLLIPAVARIGPLRWAVWVPPLKPGLGASIAGAVRQRDRIGWLALLGAAAVWQPAMFAALLLIPAWALWLNYRIGGINGDGHGAGIELVESGLLLAVVIVSRL